MDIGLLVASVSSTVPNVTAVEKRNVSDSRDQSSETHTVGQREGGAQHDGGVLAVGGDVDSVIRVKDLRDFVWLSTVVEVLVGRERKVLVEIRASPVQTNDTDDHGEDATGDVGDSESRSLERREQETSDNTPVKGDGQQTKASLATEHLVDGNIVRGNPDGEHEELEELGQNLWHPFPGKGSAGDDKEEAVTANLPAVGLAWVRGSVVVQRVHHGGGDEVSRPDHGGRPDEETASHASNTESHSLSGKDEEQLETPLELLVVEDFLSEENVDGVGNASTSSSHHGNNGVLLDVERSWVHFEGPAEESEGNLRDNLGPESTNARKAVSHQNSGQLLK